LQISKDHIEREIESAVNEFISTDQDTPVNLSKIYENAKNIYFYTNIANPLYDMDIRYFLAVCEDHKIPEADKVWFTKQIDRFKIYYDKIIGLNGKSEIDNPNSIMTAHKVIKNIFFECRGAHLPMGMQYTLNPRKNDSHIICNHCNEPLVLQHNDPTTCEHDGCIVAIRNDERILCLDCGEIHLQK